jgi:KDO2-lipid IV(A) lauroyltransferase
MVANKPPEKTERLGSRLAALWWTVSRRRKATAIKNLKMAFPHWPEDRYVQVARGVFDHFCRVAADFLAAPSRSLEELLQTTEVVGEEHLIRAIQEGRGVLLITGHFGNWERMSSYVSQKGYKLTVVARDADQSSINDMVNEVRQGPGTRVVARGSAARPILERLKANELIGILPDQNSKEIFIPFFGQPAGTVLGPGVISERAKCPVIPTACVRVGVGRYRMEFYPPLTPVEGCDQRGEGMMRAINAWLEGVITQNPEQWLWIHDRWRMARKRGLIPK